MTTRFPSRAGLICLVAAASLMAGCSSKGTKGDRPDNPFRGSSDTNGRTPLSERELRLEADQAYRRAHESLNASDFETAITRYSQLIARYPFSDYATQAELEKIYAQYRSFQPDEAITAADRFLREHPRHPNADYVQYIKGLVDFDRDNGGLIDYLPIDSSKRDVTNGRRSYDDFALLLQKFPNSRYVGDSRKRMIYLRNRISAHELSVTRYYIKRGAWVAAAKRAEAIIAEYPGAPATADSLLLLKECYDRLGQKQQSEEVALLIATNASSIQAAKGPALKPDARSVVATSLSPDPAAPPVSLAPAATPAQAAAPEPSKGLLGKAAGLLDTLNKTYTIPAAESPPAASAPADANATGTAPDYATPASLSTGPYSGPETPATIPAAKDNRTTAAPVEAEGNAQPLPPKAAPADAPKDKAGWFDFLNKTYTIGDKDEAPVAPPAPSVAPAPAANPAPVSAAPATAAPTPEVPAPVAPPPAAPAAATSEEPEKKAGLFDFLNKTYTIGGKSKPAEPVPADAPAKAEDASQSSGIKVYLDYEDDKKKSEAGSAAPATPEPVKQ